jgi:hypothetical protein
MKRTKSKKKIVKIKEVAKKRLVKSPGVKKAKTAKAKPLKPIGRVTHFYGGIKVAIVKFKKSVRAGTGLYFKGATTD